MTDENLQKWIDQMNKSVNTDLFFSVELDLGIFFTRIWEKLPYEKLASSQPDNAYFIMNKQNLFVGVVYENLYELHWYLEPKYRGRGLMFKALKETIMPHIFSKSTRKYQNISICKDKLSAINFEASKSLALKLGFQEVDKNADKYNYQVNRECFEDGIKNYPNANVGEDYLKAIVNGRAQMINLSNYYKSMAETYFHDLPGDEKDFDLLQKQINVFFGVLEAQFDSKE